ncbi:hypothetical protein [Exiguobacterium algae]|uniref:hypothetical protein n=1 Tax=Exiguobacterium algae TaxID=2751250 RepID=UPI001BEB31B7|nr:hypothetical protein [Exiguobacterium algae]
MKHKYFLILLFSLFFFGSANGVSATSKFETGVYMDQPVSPIKGTSYYLDERAGTTRIHDLKSNTTIPVDYEGNLAVYGESGFNAIYTYTPSADGTEFVVDPEQDDWLLRVKTDGSTMPMIQPTHSATLELQAYDVQRNVVIWKDASTYAVTVSDLEGNVRWQQEATRKTKPFLSQTTDEIVLVEQYEYSVTKVSLLTGDVVSTSTIPNFIQQMRVETSTNKLFLTTSGDLFVYDIETSTLSRVDSRYDSFSSISSVIYHNGLYYAFNSSDRLYVIDLAKGTMQERRMNSGDGYVLLEGGFMIQDRRWLLDLDRLDDIPTAVYASLQAVEPEGDGNFWLGEAYRLAAILYTSDGTRHAVPISEIGPAAEVIDATRTFEEGGIVPSFDAPFGFSVQIGWLESKYVWLKPVEKWPLQIDPLLDGGPLGEITGTTVPNATVYVTCEKATYSDCSGTVQSDEDGRFTFSRGIILDNQTIKIYAADAREYLDATKASIKQELVLAPKVVDQPTEVLSNTRIEGVTIRTEPFATIEVRQINSKTDYTVKEVKADEDGIAHLTTYDSSQPWTYYVFFRIVGTDRPYEKVAVIQDYPMPSVTWMKPPKTGDTTLTVYNDKLNPLLALYRNGWTETTKRLVPGLNVITLKEPLREGQTLKLVASFRPELSQTFEQKVTSDLPKTLSVKDVLLTYSTATFTIVTDPNADVRFLLNGRTLGTTLVGTNRYRVLAKSGSTIVIESAYGTKRKTLTYTLPRATIQAFKPTDELTKWTGKTLPYATVRLKNGTKVIATAKANSTGTYTLKFSRQRAGTRLVFEAKAGIHRDAKSAIVKAGVRPTVRVGTIRSTTKRVAVLTNVPYGTVYVYNGKKLVAKKSIGSTTTSVYIGSQRRGSKLTFKVVTPANRSNQTTKTVY